MTKPKKYRIIPRSTIKKPDGSGTKMVEIIFTGSMDPFEWKEFRDAMMKLLTQGFLQWRFNLQGIEYPTSTDLGMWVTCNATISKHSGNIEFVIPNDSNVMKVITLTKLDSIFNITTH
jgi:hypothetical protein